MTSIGNYFIRIIHKIKNDACKTVFVNSCHNCSVFEELLYRNNCILSYFQCIRLEVQKTKLDRITLHKFKISLYTLYTAIARREEECPKFNSSNVCTQGSPRRRCSITFNELFSIVLTLAIFTQRKHKLISDKTGANYPSNVK